jgi:hypothetical protein
MKGKKDLPVSPHKGHRNPKAGRNNRNVLLDVNPALR